MSDLNLKHGWYAMAYADHHKQHYWTACASEEDAIAEAQKQADSCEGTRIVIYYGPTGTYEVYSLRPRREILLRRLHPMGNYGKKDNEDYPWPPPSDERKK